MIRYENERHIHGKQTLNSVITLNKINEVSLISMAGCAFHTWVFTDVILNAPHNTYAINMIPWLENPSK